MSTSCRDLPGVDRLLSAPRLQLLSEQYSHNAVLSLVRSYLEQARQAIAHGEPAPGFEMAVTAIEQQARRIWQPSPRAVINATGVILHTNLGRAPLSAEALDVVRDAARSYSTLEFDLDTGSRGHRHTHVAELICELTGAEAAFVVNNNAAAVLLGLAAIAYGKEVIVSRGEAIEIGGGFRIPEVLKHSGATLVDVGTTNRTYIRDYEAAITDATGAILSAHSSNFQITGFTSTPAMSALVELGKRRGIPVLHDLGSGCLLNTALFGLSHEPMPQESISAGVSVDFFSCDKLLGGPQAGVIAGKRDFVELAAHHPLARAVRADKLCLAALSATLLHYIRNEAIEKVPVWRMIAAPVDQLSKRAEGWLASIGEEVTVESGESTIGGGSLPGETLPTTLLSIDTRGLDGGAEALISRLRNGAPPVVGRVVDECVLLDPRTVMPEEDEDLIRVIKKAMSI